MMIHRDDYGVATIVATFAWVSTKAVALWLALPGWAQKISQLLFTVFCGLVYLTAQFFWRRYLERKFRDQPPVPAVKE